MKYAVYARTTKDGKNVVEVYERKQDRGFSLKCDETSKKYEHQKHYAEVFDNMEDLRKGLKKEMGEKFIKLLDEHMDGKKAA